MLQKYITYSCRYFFSSLNLSLIQILEIMTILAILVSPNRVSEHLNLRAFKKFSKFSIGPFRLKNISIWSTKQLESYLLWILQVFEFLRLGQTIGMQWNSKKIVVWVKIAKNYYKRESPYIDLKVTAIFKAVSCITVLRSFMNCWGMHLNNTNPKTFFLIFHFITTLMDNSNVWLWIQKIAP